MVHHLRIGAVRQAGTHNQMFWSYILFNLRIILKLVLTYFDLVWQQLFHTLLFIDVSTRIVSIFPYVLIFHRVYHSKHTFYGYRQYIRFVHSFMSQTHFICFFTHNYIAVGSFKFNNFYSYFIKSTNNCKSIENRICNFPRKHKKLILNRKVRYIFKINSMQSKCAMAFQIRAIGQRKFFRINIKLAHDFCCCLFE